MMNQNYQPIYEPPRFQPPAPRGGLAWPKLLFFAHLAIFVFVAFVTMAYLYHSYRQGLQPVQYQIRGGFGGYDRGFYGGVQTARPSTGPYVFMLFGWGIGLLFHFLSVFVLAKRRFTGLNGLTGPAYYQRPSMYSYYRTDQPQPPYIPQPDPYRADPYYRYDTTQQMPYTWPSPAQPVQNQYEVNPRKDLEP